MFKIKHIDSVCIVATVIMLVLTVLFMFGEKLGITVIHRQEDETATSMFTQNDLNDEWDTADATQIVLYDDTAKITGNGAYFNNNTVYIAYAGKYVISGSLSGSVQVNADGDDKIWIMFDGVDISSDSTAPLYVQQASKVFLTLKDGSNNTLTYTLNDENETVDGAIYSRDDLTINGQGSLSVISESLHGIVCNDTLVFTGGNIDISAKTDGVHAHDAIKICNASITVKAGDDGLHAGNDDGDSEFYLESGNIDITECYEGIEANIVTIAGGTVNIAPTDDGINANGDGTNSLITISGGDITIINKNGVDADGIDSNGSINITGGNLFISLNGTGPNSNIDYGSENGGKCIVSGGTVIACGSSQTAEGPEQESPQGFIMQTVSAEGGETVTVLDKDEKTFFEKEIPCAFTSVIFSSPEISVGDTVTLKIGDTTTQITVDNSTAGGFGGKGQFNGFSPDNKSFEDNNNSTARPEKPDGKMMQRPDDNNFGSKPEFSGDNTNYLTLPNFENDNGSKPQGNFDGNGDQLPDMSDKEQKNSQADLSGTQQADESKPNVTVIILVSFSLITLIIGIAVAYKKKVY